MPVDLSCFFFLSIFYMPPRHLNFLLITASICFLCHVTHRRTRSALLVGDAVNLLDAYYVDPVNREDLIRSAMQGLTTELDEHTQYISQRDYETFQDNIQQEFAGIGVYVEQPDPAKPVRVITPLVGSPALRAGMKPGDQIVAVDGEDVSTMALQEVSERLRGPVGSEVALRVDREGGEKNLNVRRDNIKLESIVGDYRNEKDEWVFRLRDQPEIAYIRMGSFGERTHEELKAAIESLGDGYDGLVLDLRGNGGGLLDAAAEIADLFLDSGEIVSTRTRGGIIQDQFRATEGSMVPLSKPMSILIDGNSASASEILSAALQDHKRAFIVGTRSYGKGTVQNIVPLEAGRSALRLTVARYYRPSGVNIHRVKDAKDEDAWGVQPDEGNVVDLEPEDLEKIAERWQNASFPSLAEPPVPPKGGEVAGEMAVTSSLLVDPQLRRAVERINGKLGKGEVTEQSSPKQETLKDAS